MVCYFSGVIYVARGADTKILMINVLLRNATIVDSTNKNIHLKKRDILIKNGVIEKIASKISIVVSVLANQVMKNERP